MFIFYTEILFWFGLNSMGDTRHVPFKVFQSSFFCRILVSQKDQEGRHPKPHRSWQQGLAATDSGQPFEWYGDCGWVLNELLWRTQTALRKSTAFRRWNVCEVEEHFRRQQGWECLSFEVQVELFFSCNYKEWEFKQPMVVSEVMGVPPNLRSWLHY